MSAPVPDDRDGSTQVEDTVQRAYEVLRQEILMGVLHPGAVLSQVQVAGRLGISRTPLREALRRLTAEGLVTGDFRRRARVSELDLDDYDQIHAMRVALEPMAMRATVPDLTSGEIAALAAAVDGMDAAVESGDRWAFRGAHRDLHLGLTHRSGPRVRRTLTELWDHSERYRLRYLHREGSDDDDATLARLRLTQAEHRIIFEAAAARDVTGCVAGELHHLQRALETVFWEADPPPAHRLARLAADPH